MKKKTKMPETVHYRKKWQIALEQIDLAREEVVPHRAVVTDSWYGNVADFRKGLAERGESYVVGIYSDTEVSLEPLLLLEEQPRKQRRGRPRKYPRVIETNPPSVNVSELGTSVGEDGWEHLELRRDSRGKPLIVEAVSRRVWPAQGYRKGFVHEEVCLIIERRHKAHGQVELRYFFSNMPQEMPTVEMVRISHERFWIEQGYKALKDELGLDHHEGRSWTGWHRHVLLVFLAFGYLTCMRLQEKKRTIQRLWRQRLQLTLTQKRENSDCGIPL